MRTPWSTTWAASASITRRKRAPDRVTLTCPSSAKDGQFERLKQRAIALAPKNAPPAMAASLPSAICMEADWVVGKGGKTTQSGTVAAGDQRQTNPPRICAPATILHRLDGALFLVHHAPPDARVGRWQVCSNAMSPARGDAASSR